MEGLPYEKFDATALAELIRNKEVTKQELLFAAITRIEGVNPALNAVVERCYQKALNDSDDNTADQALAGVPMLLKSVTQEIAGEKMTEGSRALKHNRAKEDALFTKQLKQAGTAMLGFTNVPEFALMGVTEPALYGPAKNPWDLTVTPGGSSGGAAAAVASGMVPIAGANDGGGSIRIPAAYCGLFGLKPTRGRTPTGPGRGRVWQGAASEHVVTKSVRDSALCLDVLNVAEKTRAFHAPANDQSYTEVLKKPLKKRLKIAFSTASPIGAHVDEPCRDAVLQTVKWLEENGHHVEEKAASVDGKRIAASYMSLYFGEVAAKLTALETSLGRKMTTADVEPVTMLLGTLGRAISAEKFVTDLAAWDEAAMQMEAFHETYDLYLTPTAAMMPAKIGELSRSNGEERLIQLVTKLGAGKALLKTGMIDQLIEESLKRTPFTQLANLTGQPAMSVPVYQTAEQIPVGVQFIAARGKEDLLVQLAGALEASDQWVDVHNNPFMQL
ncbi:amidase family protein [Salisediminibacterium halotolerans]|uniref:amidase family protein n=1 Tax=Salisediminibacterium halotolerans TaxID=517425 RepID=UPI000EB4FE3B|nr:amidase family protein [Salisediminibacterium halotolerans]RLJ72256.1 amidase [Actinophytocola xinjiangensis]RPE85470.1 amidase [Salisediminibacterium halotolerans]TWG33425.1 amidase [Salisediminibacterium halotolerans]GEL07037.1 amidase [Salisediminibacterium halotolerans]